MVLPQVRAAPWYQGQIGVPGSDVQRGLRWESCGIVLYVDDEHPGATAVGDGTNPEYPLTTIQRAVDNLIAFATAMAISLEGSVIVVANEATIEETVIIPPTAPLSCSIVGAGGSRHQPTWTAAAAAGTALTIRQQGWTIEGFTFAVGGLGTAIRLSEVPLPNAYISYKTMIQNCQFDGLFGGQYGIDFYGAPHRVTIQDCEFIEFHTVATDAFAICVTDSAHTNPNQCRILNNMFWQNDNHIGSLGDNRSFNASEFRGNTFMALADAGIVTTRKLDLRGGSVGLNIVTQNVFCGDYSHTGGYWENAANPGMWIGNIAEDVLEPEVGDNGFTISVPLA